MSLISRTAQNALRAMAILARCDGRVTVKELADEMGTPQPYLARIIMLLTNEGLVNARRRPGGGLKLQAAPEKVTMLRIIQVLDGPELLNLCVFGMPECKEDGEQCPVHESWRVLRKQLSDFWEKTTLADIDPVAIARCMSPAAVSQPEAFAKIHKLRGRWH